MGVASPKPLPTRAEQDSFIDLCSLPFARLWNKMVFKAGMRAYKGPWRGRMTINEAWDRMHEEIDELRADIEANVDPEIAEFEAADVANFLAVIMDLYREHHGQ
jgi:hypothetical protein